MRFSWYFLSYRVLSRLGTLKAARIYHTVWKVSKCGAISGPYFPVFTPNAEWYGPEITPYFDTFHSASLLQMITIPFSCGEKKICSTSGNIKILWTWLQVPSFTLNKKFDFWDQICPKKSISNRKLKKWTSPLISEYSNYLIRINFWHGCNLAQIAQNRQIKSIPNLVFCSCARVNPRKKIFFSKFPKNRLKMDLHAWIAPLLELSPRQILISAVPN